ncbi:unnamed protein product [Owenia fusiformis]|uniref:G-protein coupled receptors family 2 profile 2 domain-containing protein n=1 Tax=Owenia fusiformis TaxID=6347 RepID=A0A8S4MWW9_OWEFU|nr:unnamed protein product [Owenia fusiformis]
MAMSQSLVCVIFCTFLMASLHKADGQSEVICERGDVEKSKPIDGPFDQCKIQTLGMAAFNYQNNSELRCSLSVENPVCNSENQKFSKSKHPRASCKNKCLEVKDYGLKYSSQVCLCTPKCYLYSNCCYDYHTECNKNSHQQDELTNTDILANINPKLFDINWYANYSFSENDLRNLRYLDRRPEASCRFLRYVELPPDDFYSPLDNWIKKFYYTYIGCNHDYPAGDVREKCERGQKGETFNDILRSLVPVTSNRTGATYTNIFCAMCNFESLSELLYWKTEIRYIAKLRELGEKLKEITLDDLDSLVDSIQNNDISFNFQPPGEQIEKWLEPCLPGDIIQCNSSLSEEISNFHVLQVACKSYALKTFVVAEDLNIGKTINIFFKNAACALCNGYNESQIRPLGLFGDSQSFGELPPSMAILLDFSHSGLTATRTKTGEEIKGMGRKCEETEIYDLAVDKCRPVLCGKTGLNVDSSVCSVLASRHNNASFTQNVTNELFLQCSVIKLDKDEFESNGSSLYLKRIDEYLLENQFIIFNSSAFVCANYSSEFSKLMFFDYSYLQRIMSQVGNIISLISLGITFVTFSIFPSLQTLPGKCIMNLSVAIFIAQLLMVSVMNETSIPLVCTGIAVTEHYFWLSSAFWSNVLSFDIYFTFRHKFQVVMTSMRTKRFYVYLVYAWGMPAVAVSFCFVVDYYQLWGLTIGYGSSTACWISNPNALLFTFALPLGLILIANAVFYINTVLKISDIRNLAQTVKLRGYRKSNNWQYFKMASIMGFTWIMGFVAAFSQILAFWYVFIVMNSLQGAFICFSFVCTRRTFRLSKAFFGLGDSSDQTSSFRVVFSQKSQSKTTKSIGQEVSKGGSVQTVEKSSPPLVRRDTPPSPFGYDEPPQMLDGILVSLNEVELNKNP